MRARQRILGTPLNRHVLVFAVCGLQTAAVRGLHPNQPHGEWPGPLRCPRVCEQ